MTSAIVSSTINQNFPVAGQDNNSVGFRNNFTYIKTGLATAAGEITALQATTAKTNADNDFNGVKIENAETNLLYGTIEPGTETSNLVIEVPNAEYFSKSLIGPGTSLSSVIVTGTSGQFQCATGNGVFSVGQAIKVTGTLSTNPGAATISGYVSDNIYYVIGTPTETTFTLSATINGSAITTTAGTTTGLTFTTSKKVVTFSLWPQGGFSKIRLDLTDGDPTDPDSGIARTITFVASGGTVFIDGDLTYPFVTAGDETLHYIFDVWTIDGGNNIFIKSLGTFEAI